MIPFFEPPKLSLGPLTIYGFGVAVAMAIIFGAFMVRRRVIKLGLDPDLASDLLYAVLGGGFIGAHLVDVLVYRPSALLDDPLLLFKIWNGISSFGGFFGALLGTYLFFRWKRVPRNERWGYYEALIYSLPFGWVFGRLGCFLAHDHPGIMTDFFLAVERPTRAFLLEHPDFPDGPFLDLGFLEMLYTILVVLLISFLDRRKRRPVGFYLTLIPAVYAPVRFGLDHFRWVDVRYFGLTPGQYSAFALLGLALFLWIRHPRGVHGFGKLACDNQPR
ncbi:prolipoprotein diacylglyceryl transferase [Planctomycetota bacterium]